MFSEVSCSSLELTVNSYTPVIPKKKKFKNTIKIVKDHIDTFIVYKNIYVTFLETAIGHLYTTHWTVS